MISDKQRRAAFCRWYLALGDPAEAARRAGCPPESAADDALRFLAAPACRRMLARLSQQPALPLAQLVTAGLTRLAFGSANDAAKLVFAEDFPDSSTISQLDLFHVSEIRRVKGGGVEVKLFDRQKALEKLLECADAAGSAAAASALLSALGGGLDAEEVTHEAPEAPDSPVFAEAAPCDDMVAES